MIRITNQPRRGDAVLGNLRTNEVVFVRHEYLNGSDIDTAKYEKIGVVAKRRGKKVLIAYLNNASKAWCERYSFKLTGYTLDGTERTGVLSIREASNSWASGINYTMTYQAETAGELVAQLNAFFADTTNAVFQTQDWAAQKESDDSITLHFSFKDYRQASNVGSDGFTLTANLMPDVAYLANMRRRHGGTGGEGAISSMTRALKYFRADLASATYNPTTLQTSVKRNYPLCLPAYLGTSQVNEGDQCAALRAVYGEGEAGWLKFMESCLPVYPTDFGNMGMNDGLARTKQLAAKTYTSPQKTSKTPLCPAAYYCYNIGTQCIPQGRWFLGTTRDIADLLDGIQYNVVNDRNADPVNATLLKLGGTAISNGSSFWSCLRFSTYYAWYAYGSYGYFGYYNLYSTNVAVPFSLYELP